MAAKKPAKAAVLDDPCDHVLTVLAALDGDSGVSFRHNGPLTLWCEWHRVEIDYMDALKWVDRNGFPDRVQRPTRDM